MAIPLAIRPSLFLLLIVFSAPLVVRAETRPSEPAAPRSANAGVRPSSPLWQLWTETTPRIDLRLRTELGHQDGPLKDSLASTARVRLGILSGVYEGFQGYAELEHTRSFNPDRYNAAPGDHTRSLGQLGRVVIADPESSQLNQAWLSYASPLGRVRVGRQRILYDEQRFIGNSGFRQNEQTYDGVTWTARPVKSVELSYGWLYRVNRVFGSRADSSQRSALLRDLRSRSHIAQAVYRTERFGTLRGYAYLLDLRLPSGLDARSSDTFGGAWTGTTELGGGVKLAYRAEYARQREAGESPIEYRTDYYHLRASLGLNGFSIGAAREMLGDDDEAQFRQSGNRAVAAFFTPLATLHAFNGFADLFVVQTPANGLIDNYAFATLPLTGGVRAELTWHRYHSKTGRRDYGRELDVVLSRPLFFNTLALVKVASYRRRDSAPNVPPLPLLNTLRITAQLEYRLN